MRTPPPPSAARPWGRGKTAPARPEAPRAESAARVLGRFRLEQARAELALEQRRYGAHYWDSEAPGPEVRALEFERAGVLNQLGGELAKALPPGSALAAALTPLFSESQAGPRIDFLNSEAQARIAQLIADSPELAADRAALLDRAKGFLSAEEWARFQDWNAPGPALLRRQLVGFDVNEAEFTAISGWPGFVNQGGAGFDGDAQAEAALAGEIGVDRVAELFRLRDPDVQTAVQDLHRLGLPVERAEWLASLRGEAMTRMQQVWAEPGLAAAAKEARVETLRQTYAAQLASALAPGSPIDNGVLLP